MKIFTKTSIAHKVLSIVLNFLLIFYSVAPGISASLVYAQEATSTATLEPTPTPSVEPEVSPTPTPEPTLEPTISPEPSPSPSVLPEASPTLTPSPSPSIEPSPTDQVQDSGTPLPTVGQPNAPPEISPSPSQTPELSAKGLLSATILENTDAQSLQLDLATQDVSSASLSTDKADYAPTDTAVITGSDFPKEIELKLIITADNYRFEDKVTTDENGSFVYFYQLDGTYRPLYNVEAQDLSGQILATTSFTDAPQSGCTEDSAGANDKPGQKDLTRMCADYNNLPTSVGVLWNWDENSWPGQNTGDGCSLFDTDGDGLVNYSLCVTVGGDPAVIQSTTLYSCGDGKADRCTNPIVVIPQSQDTSCSASVQPTDPFPAGDAYPNDTEASCSIALNDVGGASVATLVDVCSYPSQQPNSDPSDCIIFKEKTGRLEVTKVLDPANDPGLFNLQINGTSYASNVGNGGTTGEQVLSTGNSGTTYTVGETAGTNTNLSNYNSAIVCRDLNGTGSIVAESNDSGPLSVLLEEEDDIVCTITNTLQDGTIIVHKDVQGPNGEDITDITQNFTVRLDGASPQTFTDGGTVTYSNVSASTHTITEDTPPAGYTLFSITPDSDIGTGGAQITVNPGQTTDVYVTNRQQQTTLTLTKTVINNNGGTKQVADFTLKIDGNNVTSGVANEVSTGVHTASEVSQTGYTASSWGGNCNADGTITLALGDNKTCTITNDDQAATLIVRKVVVKDNGGTLNPDDFTFSVNGAGATAFEADGQNDLTVNAGTYNITEPAVSGYTTTYDNCSNVNIPNGGSATCTITNDDQAGTLIVKKVVVNDNGGTLSEDDFSFKVNNGSPVAFEVDGQNDLTVSAGTYNITEPAVPGYDTTYDNCSNVVIPNGGIQTCTITNDDQPAHVIVIKNVTNNDNGTKTPSDFTMHINGTAVGIGVSFPGVTGLGTNTTVNAGNYTVTEDPVAGYSGSLSGDCSTSIANGETKTCTVTNDDQPAQLIVIKHVVNDNGGTAAASAFTMHINGTSVGVGVSFPGAESPGINTMVKAGSFTVTEDSVAGYSSSTSGDCTGTIANGETKTCIITNNDQSGTLIVRKVVVNDDGGAKTAADFSFQVNGGGATLFEADGQNDLTVDAGTYNVTEPQVTGYTTTYDNCSNLNIPNGGSQTCTITNNDQAGTLIVKKIVVNDNGGTKSAQEFSFKVNDGSAVAFESDGQNDLTVNAGTYNITEPAVSGYTTTYDNCSNVNIPNGGSATCTITNNDQSATLIVKKVVTNDNGGTLDPEDFSFEVNGGQAQSFEADGQNDLTVDAGTYNITEPAVTGYDTSYDNCSNVVIPNGGSATCTITNNDQAAHLIIIKQVTNDNGGNAVASDFTMTINGVTATGGNSFPGAESPGTNKTLTSVGAYDVTETGPAGYTESDSADCSGTIALGETKTCTITNNDNAPTITLIKEVINDNGGPAGPNDFGISVGGQSVTSGVPQAVNANAPIAINESGLNGYSFVSITGDNKCPQVLGGTVTLNEGENITCTITNNDNVPSLTLVKSVTNNNGGTALPSAWTLTASGPTGFSGQGPSVSNGPSFDAGTYNLSESGGPAGYSASSWSCQGGTQDGNQITLNLGQSATCTIINDDAAGTLIVRKVVINNNGGTLNEDDFSFSVNGASAVSFEDDGQNDLTVDAGTYTITEPSVAGYDTTYDNCNNVVIPNGGTATCTITNNDKPTHLIVIKHVENDNGGTANASDFTMTINGVVVQSGGSSFSGEEAPGTDSIVEPGTYNVTEEGPSGYSASFSQDCSGTITLGETKTCTITNDDIAPKLTLVKEVNNDNGGQAEENDFGLSIDEQTVNSGETHTLEANTAYVIDEEGLEGYSFVSITGDPKCPSELGEEIVLDPGDDITCTITNDDIAPTLTLVKNLPNDNGGTATQDDFDVYIDDELANWGQNIVDAGDLTVSEDSLTGYEPSVWGGDCDEDGNITLLPGDNKTCIITNDDQPAHLILVKNLPNDNGGTATQDDFDVSIDEQEAFWGDNEVDAGSHTVSESTLTGYTPSGWGQDCDENGNVTLLPGETKTCTITNDDQAALLVVKKHVINNDGGTLDAINFILNVTGNQPDPAFFPGSESGTTVILGAGSYSVDEIEVSGYLKTLGEDCSGTIGNGDSKTCTITNDDIPGQISGMKFEDENGDGDKDAGEPGLPSWTINISGPVNTSTVTDSNGNYSFTNLPAGTYTVTETTKTGWVQTTVNPAPIVLANDQTVNGIDFGNFELGSVSGQKFEDLDGDELAQEAGEPSLSGWTIRLYDITTTPWTLVATDVTDDSGEYSFTGLEPGSYRACEVLQSGWTQLFPNINNNNNSPSSFEEGPRCQTVNIDTSGENNTKNFGNFKLGSITIVKSTIGGDDTFTYEVIPTEEIFEIQTVGNTGDKVLGDLLAGEYIVTEESLGGWDLTNLTCSTGGTTDIDNSKVTITITSGADVTCTFTNTQRGTISGTKQEVNSNSSLVGVLSDWTIYLFNNDTQELLGQQTTDGFGNFSFTNIVQGVYSLVEDLLPGWTQIFAPLSINLNPGDSSTDNNFGNFQNGTIEGIKFEDKDGDGEIGDEEWGLEGWVIFLDANENGILDGEELSTTTDADGNYEFLDLGPGSYTVCEEEQQPAWQRTKPADSNCETVQITNSGQISVVDFGNQGRSTITVHKNVDTNGDGQVDEPNATDWTWDIDGQGDFATGDTSQEVPAGSYIISEDQKEGYHVTLVECDDENAYDPSESIEVTVEPGQDLVCTFTNTRDTGLITIIKNLDNNGDGDSDDEGDVQGATNWTWDIADGEQNIATGQSKTLTTDSYTISEDLQTGYALLGWFCSNEQTGTTNSIEINVTSESQTTCTFTNQLLPPVLTLTKANNRTGIDVSAGANVLYTLTVTLTGSSLSNVSLIDLPPAGFRYRTGSWTASSNMNPGLVVSEPTYASPGAWNLGDMQTGETVTLTYIADIDAGTDPGLYKDLAWSKGTSLISATVLANESSGFFVGTEVNVVKDQGASTGVEVEKIEKKEGEVLGISTELPATGANAIWLILATFLLVGGAGLAWKGMTLRKKYE